MEKKFTKEQISLYLETEDQEIREAAFGYIIRDFVKNDTAMYQMSEILLYQEKISENTMTQIILSIGKELTEEQDIQRFIQMSYWFCEQASYICKILEQNKNPYLKKKGLEILAKLPQQAYISDACFSYLMEQTITGNNVCQKILFDIVQHHPQMGLEVLLKIAEQINKQQSIPILMTIVGFNYNTNNLFLILQYIDNCIRDQSCGIITLKTFFIQTIKHYNSYSKMSHSQFNLLVNLCNKLKIDYSDLKEITKQLFSLANNDNPLIREKKIELLKQVVILTKDYQLAIDILLSFINKPILKRVIVLSAYIIVEQIRKYEDPESSIYETYKDFILQFIKKQGSNFDKSDFEYIYGILNLNKSDKNYLQTVTTQLGTICQKTPMQIDCLLRYVTIYNQYASNVLELINWQTCPIDAAVLYHLAFNYKNTKKDIDRKIYLDIFSQLAIRTTLSLDKEILLSEILAKLNFMTKKQIEYPNIQNKINWYKERQQLLAKLNS